MTTQSVDELQVTLQLPEPVQSTSLAGPTVMKQPPGTLRQSTLLAAPTIAVQRPALWQSTWLESPASTAQLTGASWQSMFARVPASTRHSLASWQSPRQLSRHAS
jgi:hypothetical protein